ncbi:MAG: glycosyltransferase [Bdellovibrionaceae bacterium]|nr:glycosyltransferase [Pseudobdellovibrionaceae bacterium]
MDILDYKITSNKKILESKNLYTAPKASLVIGFYNSIPMIENLFASIEMQTFTNFEVIICDDGSKPHVVEFIHNYMKNTTVLIQHIWQADAGWRKVEMLNKAIKNAESEYLITIDQDCILHPEFIKEHYENREPNTVLSGRRVELSPFLTRLVTASNIKNGFLQKHFWWMFFFLFYRKDNQWDKGIYIKNKILRAFFNRKHRPVVGCNMSFHKENMERVNGFDMSFLVSCGAEDSDIGVRLENDGVAVKPLCHAAVQYHLYHTVRLKEDNRIPDIFIKNRKEKLRLTQNGLDRIKSVEKTYL